MTDKELLELLSKQIKEVMDTLLKLRKPEIAYEIVKALDNARGVMHWIGDAYGVNRFANDK